MDVPEQDPRWLSAARNAMEIEAQAILCAAGRLGDNLFRAVSLILGQPGKLIVTGMGKSGYVGRKIAATLQSTGTPAIFLHAAEALHGDIGVCQPGDATLMISKSGTTAELIELLRPLREMESRFIGILGNSSSALAGEMDVVFDASVKREADPGNFTPTASAAVALALGHALAVALMQARRFTAGDFSRFHPGGHLGRSLRTKAAEAMHRGERVAWVRPADSLKQVITAMSERPLGAACVILDGGRLAGVITDGDLRRALQAHDDIRTLCAADVMTAAPVTVSPEAPLQEALRLMEDRPSQISVLPVVDAEGGCCGLLRIHDVYRPDAQRAD